MIAVSNFSIAGIQLSLIGLAKRDGFSSAVVGGFVALVGATTLLGSLASAPAPARPIAEGDHAVRVLGGRRLRGVPRMANVCVLAAAFAVQAFCFPNTDSAVAAYSYALIPDRLPRASRL